MAKHPAETLAITAPILAARNILQALVDKGLLTGQEAGRALVQTAEEIRQGTEDDPASAPIGEACAQAYEDQAKYLMAQ